MNGMKSKISKLPKDWFHSVHGDINTKYYSNIAKFKRYLTNFDNTFLASDIHEQAFHFIYAWKL